MEEGISIICFDQVRKHPYNGDISAEVSSRLKAGVRVWHNKVSLGAYYQPNQKGR